MREHDELSLLLSVEAEEIFGKRIQEVLRGRNYKISNLDVRPQTDNQYDIDFAFLSRDVTGNSGKQVLSQTLERFYEIIRNSPKLSWIQMAAAGADRPIYKEMSQRGVVITSGSGSNSGPVAQMAVTGILSLARCLPFLMQNQRQKKWVPLLGPNAPQDLYTQTVLIIGWGPIGQEVGRLCKSFGMRVIGVRRQVGSDEYADKIISYQDLDNNLPNADWVVIACPLNDITRGLINKKTLSLLPNGARVVNVSRGEVIVEEDLVAAIESEKIGGAFLDVVIKEPLDESSPLWSLPNVILTPHTAGHTKGHYEKVGEIFLDNLNRWVANKDLRNLLSFNN